ncbi:MAG: hypothetical protein JJLCMIEE_02949 [Acidimicrobiales bacterium]|nr:MAG: hypothetical protein EDR02_15530 [Actinomycetota bacterium]MBV6509839.1 hypothetical protein [Acidimicrobiales bacterium]RIK03362.1 MAG: hypothetical protein DCC48_16545 [Acidobacteriota bacterium]
MAKRSSDKKIQKVQRAGKAAGGGGRQRRNLAYPLLIAAIVVVGVGMVWFARERRSTEVEAAPTLDDHWHSAYGTYICDGFQPNLADVGQDAMGIHTHEDGLIHIHPFSSAVTGENATLGVWLEQVGLTAEDDRLVMPDGTEYIEGETKCEIDGKEVDAEVVLYKWPPQASPETEPDLFTSDFGSVRLAADGEAYVLAFVPEGTDVPLPPNVEALANPSDEDPTAPTETSVVESVPGTETTTSTVATTSSTVAGAGGTAPTGGG